MPPLLDYIEFLKHDLGARPWCPHHTPTLCFVFVHWGGGGICPHSTGKHFFSKEIALQIFSPYFEPFFVSFIWWRWLRIMELEAKDSLLKFCVVMWFLALVYSNYCILELQLKLYI